LLNTVIRDELGNGGTCVSSIVGHVIESMWAPKSGKCVCCIYVSFMYVYIYIYITYI
jgi:hypothetical protein